VNSVDIHSYRTVFELERRIYRVDRLRLNPSGVPVRAPLYGLALLATALLMARAPLLGLIVRALPWYLTELAMPVIGAATLAMIRVEGRSFNLAARALLGYALSPRRLAGMRRCAGVGAQWWPPEMLILADGSEARFRRVWCEGPGRVLVGPAHERVEWEIGVLGRLTRCPQMTLSELPGQPAPSRSASIVLVGSMRLRVG
jgi:hypothetical protein